MMTVHLLVMLGAALGFAGWTFVAGESVLATIATYAGGGALGLLASAGGPVLLSWLREDRDGRSRDRDLTPHGWGPVQRPDLRMARPRAPRPAPSRRRPDLRLRHAWAFEPNGDWPEEVPAILRLRLLDAQSYGDASPEDLWDEVRAWLVEEGVTRARSRPGARAAQEIPRPVA